MRRAITALVGPVLVLVLLGACGGDGTDSASTATSTTAESTTAPGSEEHGAGGVDQGAGGEGDLETGGRATPADQVEDAEVTTGDFELLDTRPEGYEGLSGRAVLARHGGGTTVTLLLLGLRPGAELVAHVHEGNCAEGGGPHYKFDPDGGDAPPNEIHLRFTAEEDTTAQATVEDDRRAGDAARSVAIHEVADLDATIACAPLEPA